MGFLDSIKGMFGKGKQVADVNNDGQVNAADASAAVGAAKQAADVNNDGQVNAADAQTVASNVKDKVS